MLALQVPTQHRGGGALGGRDHQAVRGALTRPGEVPPYLPLPPDPLWSAGSSPRRPPRQQSRPPQDRPGRTAQSPAVTGKSGGEDSCLPSSPSPPPRQDKPSRSSQPQAPHCPALGRSSSAARSGWRKSGSRRPRRHSTLRSPLVSTCQDARMPPAQPPLALPSLALHSGAV